MSWSEGRVHTVLCTDGHFSAIVASSVGLYFRVPESQNSDLAWNEAPAAGLA